MLTCLINQYHFSLLIYLISVFATWPCCCFIAISVFSLSIGKAISCSQWSWKLFWKWHFVVNHQQREGKKSGVFLNGSTCQIKHCFVQRMKVEPKNIVIFIPVHPNDTFCYFARIGCVTDFTTLSSCKPWKKKKHVPQPSNSYTFLMEKFPWVGMMFLTFLCTMHAQTVICVVEVPFSQPSSVRNNSGCMCKRKKCIECIFFLLWPWAG